MSGLFDRDDKSHAPAIFSMVFLAPDGQDAKSLRAAALAQRKDIQAALRAALGEFTAGPEAANLRRLRNALDAAKKAAGEAKAAPDQARWLARRLIIAGEDPAPAEAEYREAVVTAELLANRVEAHAGAVAQGRSPPPAPGWPAGWMTPGCRCWPGPRRTWPR